MPFRMLATMTGSARRWIAYTNQMMFVMKIMKNVVGERSDGNLSRRQRFKDLRIEGDTGKQAIGFGEQINRVIVTLDSKASAESV